MPHVVAVGRACSLALLLAGLSVWPLCNTAGAQSTDPVGPGIERSLSQSADEGGPRALLSRLAQILADNPRLAADPDNAAALARAASIPVTAFRGANLPVYRDIAARIVDAAPEARRPEITKAVATAVAAVASTDPSIREPLPPELTERKARQARAEATEPTRGARVGSFIVYPEMSVIEFWDDNIYATKTAKVDDFATVYAPHAFVVSDWDKHALRFEAHTDATRYASNENEDSTDYWGGTDGRFDFTPTSNAFAGGTAGKFHEDRDSPDEANGTEPTAYRDYSAYAGMSHQIGEFVVRPGLTWRQLRFDDTPTATTLIDNTDRDRTIVSGGARVAYSLTDVLEPFVDLSREDRTYRTNVDNFGFDRDSTGYRYVVGTNIVIKGTLQAEVFGGWLRRNYDDSNLSDVSSPAFGGNVAWRALPPLLLTLWVDRSIEETTLFGSSSYLYTGGGATVEYTITSDLLATLRASASHTDFQSSSRLDRDYDASIGLRYTIAGGLFAAGDYRFQRRSSTLDAVDYDRNQIFLRLGYRY